MSVPLTVLPMPCANLPSYLVNECLQIFVCWASFIRSLYSIVAPVAGSKIALAIFFLGLLRHLPRTFIGILWLLGQKIGVWVLSALSFIKYSFIPVGWYWIFILWYKKMVWWVQVFWLYPPLDMVQWFYVPTLVVHECPPLVVLDPLHI